jgi:hypothetical protein
LRLPIGAKRDEEFPVDGPQSEDPMTFAERHEPTEPQRVFLDEVGCQTFNTFLSDEHIHG